LRQKLDAERARRVEFGARGNAEKTDLLEFRIGLGELVEPLVVLVLEQDGLVVLDELETVEDAAADEPRAAEAVVAVGGEQQRALPRREPGFAEA